MDSFDEIEHICANCQLPAFQVPGKMLGYFPQWKCWLCGTCNRIKSQGNSQFAHPSLIASTDYDDSDNWEVGYQGYREKMHSGWRGCLGMIVLFFACLYYWIKDFLFGRG